MMNNLLNVIVLGSLVGTFVVFAPAPEPRAVASRPSSASVAAAPVPAVSASTELLAQQPPIPLVRSQRVSATPASAPVTRPVEPESQASDGQSKTAAKSAIEADGYRNVTVLSKGADGTWRAKAYRGSTEVQLTVDGAGRVASQ
jgi:hypothetical protein